MRVGILTGGGDVPGLNPAVKAVVSRLVEGGHEAVGIRRGWGGLLNLNPDDPDSVTEHTLTLDESVVRAIDRTGGTFLHTSRFNPGRVGPADVPPFLSDQRNHEGPSDFTPHVLSVVEALQLDALVPIGGDDTLSYGLRMHEEGVPVVAIPKTMDNDVNGTDYCIGFGTAVTRGVNFINNLRTSAGSHERIAVVELFGRYSGETSLITAYVASADRALISEVPFEIERLAELVMVDKARNPANYAMVTISEGASIKGGEIMVSGEADPYGHRKLGGIGLQTGALLKEATGEDILYQQVGYLMRSGPPDPLDVMVASNYGRLAADLIVDGRSGLLVALRDGVYTSVPVAITGEAEKRVRVDELYDVEEYRPSIRAVSGKPMFLY